MLARVFAIAMNTYREHVRARILIGLFVLALATCAYALFVAKQTEGYTPAARVVSDVGAAAASLYAVLTAVVLGATALHREVELKTVYPVLARPLHRHEYLVGKFLGTVLVLAVFLCIDAAAVFGILAWVTGQRPALVLGAAGLLGAILAVLLVRARTSRVYVLVPWSIAAALAMWLLASPAGADRQLVSASVVLALAETTIVTGVATLFSSFSSPFLTATFTLGVFVVGRSADTLAHLPQKQFGPTVVVIGRWMSHVVPNLHLYVPPRPLLLGSLPEVPTWPYVGSAAAHAIAYASVTIALAAIVFRRRDFT